MNTTKYEKVPSSPLDCLRYLPHPIGIFVKPKRGVEPDQFKRGLKGTRGGPERTRKF